MNALPFIIVGSALFLFATKEAMAMGGEIGNGVSVDTTGRRKFGSAWNKYDALFRKAENDYGIPFEWLKSIAIIESSLGTDPRVVAGGVSSDGLSWGLMQFTMPTARDFDSDASIDKLNNDAYSIDLAGQYLQNLSGQFNGDERKIIMSYNQGAGNTRAGKTFAAGYYTKFLEALTLVNGG